MPPPKWCLSKFPDSSVLREPVSVEECVRRAQQNLLRLQKPDGHWEGELLADATLCSDYIIYMHWSAKIDESIQSKCASHIRRRQFADGGWNIFIGGPSEVNASVKAYFALKLAGDSPNSAWMREGTRQRSALRRGPADQHLREVISGASRAVSLAISAHDSAGDLSLPKLVFLQSLPNVVLEPRDYRAAHHPQSLQAHASAFAGDASSRVVSGRPRKYRSFSQEASPVLGLAELFSSLRQISQDSTTRSPFILCAGARSRPPRHGWSSEWVRGVRA